MSSAFLSTQREVTLNSEATYSDGSLPTLLSTSSSHSVLRAIKSRSGRPFFTPFNLGSAFFFWVGDFFITRLVGLLAGPAGTPFPAGFRAGALLFLLGVAGAASSFSAS